MKALTGCLCLILLFAARTSSHPSKLFAPTRKLSMRLRGQQPEHQSIAEELDVSRLDSSDVLCVCTRVGERKPKAPSIIERLPHPPNHASCSDCMQLRGGEGEQKVPTMLERLTRSMEQYITDTGPNESEMKEVSEPEVSHLLFA